ncbi:MAG: response regulator [Proteobacteria bacterium]|nr:response regulator [Pseudomonadota bacterium]MBU1737954.1 response regulator [Pseudomonadota bacterium]
MIIPAFGMDVSSEISKNRKKILLVDDDPVILEMLQTGLENEGYDLTVAENGKEALRLLLEKKFDLVVTDLKMEPIGGIQLLKEAKELCEDLTGVIIITGHADMNAAIEALRLGADDFITKPAKLEEISWRVEKFLVQQQRERKIKVYEDILPICSYCRKIKDITGKEDESWHSADEYLNRKTTAQLSHGLCPDCYAKEMKNLDEFERKLKK